MKTYRISRESCMMETARIWAERSTCNRLQVGSVIEKEGRIISLGYTGSPPGLSHCLDEGCIIDKLRGGCIRTLHAELNSICFAAKNGISVNGATLYVTTSPCIDCAKAIVASGIKRIYYDQEYRNKEGIEYLKKAGLSVLKYSYKFEKKGGDES